MPDINDVISNTSAYLRSQEFGFSEHEIILFKDSGNSSNGYITFTLEDNTDSALKTKIRALFQHLPKNLSDSRKAQYQIIPILKRTEPFLVYQSTGFREIALSLTFHAETPQDAYDLFAISSLLRRSVLPTKRGTPNNVKIFLGNWFTNYALQPSGSGGKYTMVKDEYTESIDGFNAIIEGVDLTPSENRFVSADLTGISAVPQGWNEKLPSSIDVGLQLKVFLADVWAINYDKSSIESSIASRIGDVMGGEAANFAPTDGVPGNSSSSENPGNNTRG